MNLSKRQESSVQIVQQEGPITGKAIATKLDLTRSALRSDLTVLTMMGILDARPKVGYYYVGKVANNPLAAEINSFTVAQVMSSVVAVSSTASVYDTIVTMFTEDVGTILICDDGILKGVASRKDLLRASLGGSDLNTMPISMIMTPTSKVVVSYPDMPVVEAVERMIDFEIDCVPVVDKVLLETSKEYRVVGRISKTTVTRLFWDCGKR